MTDTVLQQDDLIPQDHKRGPGWFLRIAYAVIAVFCVYYWFTYADWKSGYEQQQQEITKKIGK